MRLLVVEDDPRLREAIVDTLMIKGHEVCEAGNGNDAMAIVAAQPLDLVLSDINMPGMDGLGLLEAIKSAHPWLPVVLMTAYGDVGQAVKAMQRGANDYLMKPFELPELDKILQQFNQTSSAGADDESEPVCEAVASRQLFQLAERVAQTDSTVLISGESGTGKEVLARYIHQHSSRRLQPFIAINCAAIPENMLEAMLFGYEKGAFTGAYNAMPGKFEQADGGTLLLDEITEMDLGLQAKLLRVLQERQVERLGGKKVLDLDVRIVATTNRDLAEYVADGQFREDLYYRLSVFPLHWLPLRERKDDILPLAKRLLAHHAAKMKRPVPSLAADAELKLMTHTWPGNVRELDNTMQRALIIQSGPQLFAADFILTPVPKNRQSEMPVADVISLTDSEQALGNDLKNREVELIVKALKEEPSRKDAADRLGISPRTLRYKMARLRDDGIDVEAMLA
ncbi:MAG: sigma-54-dependent Fis family transcriptional regulator [Oceanospirillaceae bacterium]|uniref:sigma-54-dependent transcriptional regulator n=1 Tax=unclassified Thalassolituus TaxID=2624967 RepID=UPI000C57D286|nr:MULTISPECIES: sigma-54 dependent transcriptional regulator [unclassified Thalassolituus]MAS25181.1 sigma-54-dependent Fis family transcriptional regulator [Oceanospirillaceae bacterium]MBL33689.1 sigma-54-dependent Fis family transcriptional regulator [Oceanospirillaceae bacterium]MBS51687.1 sigma-54-dependent Fis family transcriptional regulator [Oceanospirillaceae bacterium]